MQKRAFRRWTEEETEYLIENWGKYSVSTIAKNLNRTENSIINKINRIGLCGFKTNCEYITLNQLVVLMCGKNGSSTNKNKLLNNGLPAVSKKINKSSVKFIDIDKFWEWAEENKNSLNFRRLEENILGREPSWVKEKRRNDILQFNKKNAYKRWTNFEIEKLKKYTELGYDLKTIAKELKRSEGAIRRKKYNYYLD